MKPAASTWPGSLECRISSPIPNVMKHHLHFNKISSHPSIHETLRSTAKVLVILKNQTTVAQNWLIIIQFIVIVPFTTLFYFIHSFVIFNQKSWLYIWHGIRSQPYLALAGGTSLNNLTFYPLRCPELVWWYICQRTDKYSA